MRRLATTHPSFLQLCRTCLAGGLCGERWDALEESEVLLIALVPVSQSPVGSRGKAGRRLRGFVPRGRNGQAVRQA